MEIENLSGYLYEKLEDYIEKKTFEGKRIVLFGLNTSSYGTKKYLEEQGYQIDAFIDNDRRKVENSNDMVDILLPRHLNGEDYQRVEKLCIRSYIPEDYLRPFQEDFVILIASKYYLEMCEQLKKLGYQEGIHIIKTADFYDMEYVLRDGKWSDGLREMDRGEIRGVQLEILEHVKTVCKENNIMYYLGAGSCLGAVRHKGYIPWDDDIDINLPYPDYIRLLEALKEEERYKTISLYDYENELPYFFTRIEDTKTVMKNWEYPFLITSGVTIDVFPIFGLPDRQRDVMSFYDRIRKLNAQLIESYIINCNPDEKELQHREELVREICNMMGKYDYDESENIGYVLSKNGERDIMKRRIYHEAVEMDFEGHKFNVMSGYDEYLTALYGEYMKMPSDKEQRTTHSFRAFFKN